MIDHACQWGLRLADLLTGWIYISTAENIQIAFRCLTDINATTRAVHDRLLDHEPHDRNRHLRSTGECSLFNGQFRGSAVTLVCRGTYCVLHRPELVGVGLNHSPSLYLS